MSEKNVEIVWRAFAYECYGIGGRAEAEAITLREAKVSQVDEFDEMAKALEAAGISE